MLALVGFESAPLASRVRLADTRSHGETQRAGACRGGFDFLAANDLSLRHLTPPSTHLLLLMLFMLLQEWGVRNFCAGVLCCPSAATSGKPGRYCRSIRRVGRGVGFIAGDLHSLFRICVDGVDVFFRVLRLGPYDAVVRFDSALAFMQSV